VSKENNISNQKQKKHIFLLGYMGSGKSKLGERLARALAKNFVDTDDTIENKTGMPIRDIFSERGEDHFRNLEQQLLKELIAYPPSIIATGGGMPCYNNGVGLMNEIGTTIYLETGVDVLVQRLWPEKEKRPLLSKLQDERALFDFINKHITVRSECYLKSDYTVNADLDIDAMIEKLMLIPVVAENKDPEL